MTPLYSGRDVVVMVRKKMNKPYKNIIILLISLNFFLPIVFGFIISNITEDFYHNRLNEFYLEYLYDSHGRKKEFLINETGIPVTDYGYLYGDYLGKFENPVHVCQYGFTYFDLFMAGKLECKQKWWNCVNWVMNHSEDRDNSSFLPYNISWPDFHMTAPWYSGLAQGCAVQLLLDAYNYSKEEKYLEKATRFLNSFFVTIESNGITNMTENDGWWYEEYADINGSNPRVLNGMMFAVLYIYAYNQIVHDNVSSYLFSKGILALKNNLYRYDNDGDSYYNLLGLPAGEFYSGLHIKLLGQLYSITKEPVFKKYYDKWKEYADSPFIQRFFDSPNSLESQIILCNIISISIPTVLLSIVVLIIMKKRLSGK